MSDEVCGHCGRPGDNLKHGRLCWDHVDCMLYATAKRGLALAVGLGRGERPHDAVIADVLSDLAEFAIDRLGPDPDDEPDLEVVALRARAEAAEAEAARLREACQTGLEILETLGAEHTVAYGRLAAALAGEGGGG